MDATLVKLTTRMTYEEYAALPDDGRRYELIDGELVVAASPNGKHLIVCRRYFLDLTRFVDDRDLGMVYFAPYDLQYAESGAVQPDVFFVSRDRLGIVRVDQMVQPPDLIAEVLSPSNRQHDLRTKASIYARMRVKEYWTFDPENESIVVRVLCDGVYRDVASPDGIARSALLPGFAVDPAVIFDWPDWLL